MARELLGAELVVLARRDRDGALHAHAAAVEPSAEAESTARVVLAAALRGRIDDRDGGVAVVLEPGRAAAVAVGSPLRRGEAGRILAVAGRAALVRLDGPPAPVPGGARRIEVEATIADAIGELVRDDPASLDDRIVAGLGRIAASVGASAAFVRRAAAATGRAEVTHLWRSAGVATPIGQSGLGRDAVDWLGARFAGSPVVLLRRDEPEPAEVPPLVAELLERCAAVAFARLGDGGTPFGLLGLVWQDVPPGSAESLAGIAAFAAALDGALTRQAADALARSQAAVLELIARGNPVADTLAAVARVVDQRCPGTATVVFLTVGPGPAELVAAPAVPRSRRQRLAGESCGPGSPVARVVADREPVVTPPPDRGVGVGPPSGWWVPIVGARADDVLGVIAALSLGGDPVAPDPVVLDAAALAAIAIERHRDEEWLAFQATHDGLTGLANRTHLVGRVELALARSRRTGRRVAVLFCDLDRFKEVNDRHGHDEGDRLLVEVADRLARVVRPTDTVARFGGDEFVLLLDDVADDEDALVIARRVTTALRVPPLQVAGSEWHLTTSVGVAVSTSAVENPEELLRDADAALYRAKHQGRDRVELFGAGPVGGWSGPDRLGEELAAALGADELELAYQPIVDPRGGGWVGVEALLRWRHPRRGHLSPAEFLAVADSSGLIVPIGEWVVRTAARQLDAWSTLRPTLSGLRLHVNLSARQLAGTAAVDAVAEALVTAPVSVDRVTLEIGERTLLDVPPAARTALDRFAAIGVRLAVDDFGAEAASLTALRDLPLAEVRIDGALVRSATREPVDRRVLAAVVELGHALGLEVSAEGVETAGQLDALCELGVDTVQGRHVGPPMTPDELLRRLPEVPLRSP